MRCRRQRRRGRKGIAAVGVVLFLLCVGIRWRDPQRQSGSVTLSFFQKIWEESLFEEPSLTQLLWNEQRQAVSVGMRAENQLVSGDVLGTTGQVDPEIIQESDGNNLSTAAPEDMAEWKQSITERDEDLLAEIDRENEAMRQQAELLQQQQNDQVGVSKPQADQQSGGLQTLALPYTREQLGSLDFLKEHLYNVNRGTKVTAGLLDADALLSMDMTWEDPDSDGPKVLIHHTHATEYFADSNEKDEATLIVGVGDHLEEILETQYGIQVIHDRTVYPYNEAYSQALKHVESILAENPTIEVFIDLHRDAGGTKKYTVNVEGQEMAHLMFFNGLSHSTNGPIDYLPNENLQANLAFSFQMKMVGDSFYPGLCKRNYLKAYRYNLHVLPRAVIVEVGDNNNTLQEAKNAMEPLAQILHLILTGGA